MIGVGVGGEGERERKHVHAHLRRTLVFGNLSWKRCPITSAGRILLMRGKFIIPAHPLGRGGHKGLNAGRWGSLRAVLVTALPSTQ